MAQPIQVVGTLYCFLLHVVVESPDHCAWLAGNFQSKVLFETKHSEAAGETTAVQIRNHPSQEKFFDFLGKLKFPSYFDRWSDLIVTFIITYSHSVLRRTDSKRRVDVPRITT